MQTRCNVFILAHCALRTSKWGLFLGCDIWILMRTFHPRHRSSPLLLSSLLSSSIHPVLFHFFPAFLLFPFCPRFFLLVPLVGHSRNHRALFGRYPPWQQSPDFTTLVAIPKKDSSLADARKIFLWETFRGGRSSAMKVPFNVPNFWFLVK